MSLDDRAIRETNFQLPGQTKFYRGKVRDVYTVGNQLVMVATDRISAFDHILPRAIPYKGQVLNQIAAVKGAMSSVAKIILEDHLEECLIRAADRGNLEAEIEELKKALNRFIP